MRSTLLLLLLPFLMLSPACQRFTKEGADEEVYGLLDRRRTEVEQVRGTLDIESKETLADAIRRRAAFDLDLREALELGTVASRDYRRQREAVYLAALELTRQLNEFRPLWDFGGSADYRADEDGSSIGGDVGFTLSRAFERGGGIVIGLASAFLRDISGDPLKVAQTILSADVTLPLLRGAGELVAKESLRQAERDVLYALRDYARFQQEFTVSIASRFYRSLQTRDSWRNAEARYESLKLLVDEQRAKAEEGRVRLIDVDQVEQDLLESDDARQRAKSNYDTSVDQLKLDLGIPVTVEVTLTDRDLAALREAGPEAAPFDRERALVLSETRRLDLRTQRDAQADAERRVLVARDGLRAGLGLRLGGDVATPGDRPLDFGDAESSGNIGLDLDLPLERTAERNAYRRALIDAGRAKRDRERFEDTVVFEVRDAYRTLEEARRSYEIQLVSARLAERRVDSTQDLLELGAAQTRDRLEAEDALLRARNAVTAALVDHVLARLALERDVGTLRVDASGMWAPSGAAVTAPQALDPTSAPTLVQDPTPAPGPASTPDFPPPAPPTATPPTPPPAAGTLPPPVVTRTGTPARRAPAARAPSAGSAARAAEPRPSPPRRPGAADGGLPPPAVTPRRSGTLDE